MAEILVYTDGGAVPNPGTGGWGVVINQNSQITELHGGELNTTNNRMELNAAIGALSFIKESSTIKLYTDSQYVKNGITAWIPNWKKLGWKRKSGALKNVDLWQALDKLTEKHEITWQWVKGHAGHPQNERCDQLATLAIQHLNDNANYFENGYKVIEK